MMKVISNKSFKLLIFFNLMIFNQIYSQNTLQIIKFEEASELYNNNKFKKSVSILNDLEKEG
ncbi:MAG: hypothetical protein WD512_04175, partial [Candidatus Paceibacterota bacterium]